MDSNSFRLSDIKVSGNGFRLVTDGRGSLRIRTDSEAKPSGKRKIGIEPHSRAKISKSAGGRSRVAVASAEVKSSVLLDPASNTRIAYRILNPEDLNLCAPSENRTNAHHKKASRKMIKPKASEATENRICDRAVAVTRSGRRVRPPRSDVGARVGCGDECVEAEKMIDEMESQKNRAPLCARIVCPACRKAYRGSKRMGRHLSANPTHAINDKCKKMLEEYLSERARTDAQTQTEEADDVSLFGSLSRILRNVPAEERASAFVGQLAELTSRLRRLLPTLMRDDDESASPCLIDVCVGKILDVAPGKYRLNASALMEASESTEPEWSSVDFADFGGTRDPVLGSDFSGLGFSDSRSSQIGLDLQLDLFPFHHSHC